MLAAETSDNGRFRNASSNVICNIDNSNEQIMFSSGILCTYDMRVITEIYTSVSMLCFYIELV